MGQDLIKVETITKLHSLAGLPAPKHPLVSVVSMCNMTSKIMEDVTFVPELYMISLKMGMQGSIKYGRNSYDFQEGTMVFTKPFQALTIVAAEQVSDQEGWSLIFHPDLIRKSELGKTIDNYTFFSYDVNEALHLSEDERDSVTDLVRKIEKEYNNNIDRHSQDLIIANIELLLRYCTRYYDRQFYTRTNLNKDMVSGFERMLKEYYTSNKQMESGVPSVKYCAGEMNMSSHYLSDMLRKETGKSAQEHIYNFLINRAKTMLLSSADSISRIAYDLGFEYPQHFSKLFKSKTGQSPAAYRKAS